MEEKKKPQINHYDDGTASVLRKRVMYTELRFYQRSDVLYQLTQVFCHRFLKHYGDRTVDQMVQAARSTKQNIVEGSCDGETSMETELKLLGVARGSNQELLQDYQDYIKSHKLTQWAQGHARFDAMLSYCREHNQLEDYELFFDRWDDEEMSNTAITLCRMVDKMMTSYQKKKEDEFIKGGGLRERMTAVRLGYRGSQKEALEAALKEIETLRKENAELKAKLDSLYGKN
jgi:four helix bundle suffix protein